MFYDLGFDESTTDVKLVGNFCYVEGERYTTRTSIYSVKRGTWRDIQHFPSCPVGTSGVYFKGLIYWAARSVEINRPLPSTVVSLDLAEEIFSEFKHPVELDEHDDNYGVWSLGISSQVAGNGRLSIFYSFDEHIEIWGLNVEDKSWIKMVTAPLAVDPMEHIYHVPFYFANAGKEVMLKKHVEVHLYNQTLLSFRECLIANFTEEITPERYFSAFEYIPSDISP